MVYKCKYKIKGHECDTICAGCLENEIEKYPSIVIFKLRKLGYIVEKNKD